MIHNTLSSVSLAYMLIRAQFAAYSMSYYCMVSVEFLESHTTYLNYSASVLH